MFANESVTLEYRYIRGISFIMGEATNWITAGIDEFGLTETRSLENWGGGVARKIFPQLLRL